MNVSLTPELEKFIRKKVSSGLYNNASEVVREALRLLVRQESTSTRGSLKTRLTKAQIHEQILSLKKTLHDRGINSILLFGSAVRNENTPASDIDLIVDIDPEAKFSLLDLVGVKHFLEDNLRCGVDVVTRDGLHPHIRENIINESEQVF